MRKINYLLLFVFVLTIFSCQSEEKQKKNTLTKKELSEGWTLLFNGKDLKNWKMFNGGDVTGWKIIDGDLYNSGVGSDHGGDIITKKIFKNFELSLEWKIDTQSNSGIFYHVKEGVVDKIYLSGPEYQLIDENWKDPIKAYQHTAANYSMQPTVGAKTLPAGQWNTTKIVVKNPHVEHWLNGKKVVEYELWSDKWNAQKMAGKWKNAPYYGIEKEGHIGFQDHGGLTVFRNIKIRELK